MIIEILLNRMMLVNHMFVVIAEIQLKKGLESEFKNWVTESNKSLAKFEGFVGRRLLESHNGKHLILVEFESKEKFENMHKTEEHARIQSKGHSYMDGLPKPMFYNVISQ
jgi:heme-degrading monooxygenase HmoA